MSAEATGSTNSAPMVTDEGDSSPLREMVRDGNTYREVEMEDASGEDSSSGEEEGEKDWEEKDRGKPNFKCAVPGAGPQQSSQEFFRRSARLGGGVLDVFETRGKMRGALTRSLSTAAQESPQQRGTALTLNAGCDTGVVS